MKIGWYSDREFEGIEIHPLLGRARVDYWRRRTLFLPIPLNLLIVFCDKLYLKARKGGGFSQSVWAAGYHEGYEAGYADSARKIELLKEMLKKEIGEEHGAR